MKTVRSLFLVALLVASAFSSCVNRGPADVFVGDHSALDYALNFNQNSVSLTSTTLGAHDGLTFEIEVFPRAFTGCLFSFGSGANLVELSLVADPQNQQGQIHFRVAGQEVATGGIMSLNAWHTIAVVYDNTAEQKTATIYLDGQEFTSGNLPVLTSGDRQGFLGFCPSANTYLNGALDNFVVTSAKKSLQQLRDTHDLIFPFLPANDLIQLWTFNDAGAVTYALAGDATTHQASAQVTAANRIVKSQVGAGAKVTDKFCTHSGQVVIAPGSTEESLSNVAPFQGEEGGLSQTFACNGGADFTFNQKWANGGITQVGIKTSINHRFRVTANPGASLVVEHESWGGFTRLPVGSGMIKEDRTGFSISETEVVIQAAKYGWISITQDGGFLKYQYAINSAQCNNLESDVCKWLGPIEQFEYAFANPPLPEPMGNQQTSEGVLDLPAVLACPTPTLTGYNPFFYCWGWLVGPQVGYRNDWNGNRWQTSDPGCCNNPNVITSNQWTVQRWGHLVAGQTLPWCGAVPIPPIPPPQSKTPPPTYGEDPCKDVEASALATYRQTCAYIWSGANGQVDTTDGRYLGCVAQLCLTQDPGTVPPPDCKTELLLESLDNTYTAPAKCKTDCPSNCNFNGDCNAATCACKAGWTGPSCGQPATFPCFTVENTKSVQPVQLTLANKVGGTILTTQSVGNPIYTDFYQPGKFYVADSLFVYIAQTVDNYVDRNPTYHLWIVSNDPAGSGTQSFDYTVTITGVAAGVSMVDIYGAGTTVTDSVGTGLPHNSDTKLSVSTIKINFRHGASNYAAAVVRMLPGSFAGSMTVTGTTKPAQVLIGGSSTAPKALLDIVKVPQTSWSTGFQIGGATCSNNVCPYLDCAGCTTNPDCGWCVENSECLPGNAAGPAFGQCLNWRFSFDSSISRRITQIPAYPVNPGQTEVFLAAGQTQDLPIDLGVVPLNVDGVEWDLCILNDFHSVPKSWFTSQNADVLTTVGRYPNSGIAYGSIQNAGNPFSLIKAITNPRDTDGIKNSLLLINTQQIALGNSALGVKSALARLANINANDFALRATRHVCLFTVARDYADEAGVDMSAVADGLLAKGIIPVFATTPNLRTRYQQLVNSIGFGSVIELVTADLRSTIDQAFKVAGYSVKVILGQSNSANSHIDVSAFNAAADSYEIRGLKNQWRAMFQIPVLRNTGSPDKRTSKLSFPGFGQAIIENIPTGQADLPWTTAPTKFVMDEDTELVIELTGMSFRGLMSVTPTITAAPSKGDLYRASLQNGVWVAEDKIVSYPATIVAARVVYKPLAGESGVNYASFSYTVKDTCIASPVGSISIDVNALNKAPVAEMPGVVTPQWTPVTIALGFSDDKKGDGGSYQITIVNTVATEDGALYAYTNAFDKFSPGTPLTDGAQLPVDETRVIYLPPRYKHSQADPVKTPELLILPCLTYQVAETNGNPSNLVSNEHQVDITVTHVNEAPFVWADGAWPLTSRPWPTPLAEDDQCWSNTAACTFKEDFNEEFWWNTGFQYVFLGGDDIEGSQLTFEITEVDCLDGTEVRIPLADDQNIATATGPVRIYDQPSGQLLPLLRFRPLRETHDSDRTDGKPYCTIKYRVIDDEDLASANENAIEIHITDVNKQPRLESESLKVVALEGERKAFFIDVVDPEKDSFTMELVGCKYADKGTFELCADADCTSTVTLDCAAPGPVTGVTTLGQYTPDGVAIPIAAFFTSGDLLSPIDGADYNTLTFKFSDSESAFVPRDFYVDFSVVVINNAPVLFIDDTSDVSEKAYTLDQTQDFRPAIFVHDVDFDGDNFYRMKLTITLENSATPSVHFDAQKMKDVIPGERDSTGVTETSVTYEGTQTEVNAILGVLTLTAPVLLQEGEGAVSFTVNVNDLGFVGQCSDITGVTIARCELFDELRVNVQYSSVPDNSMVTVASSAAAAGVAGAAAIAAVALFRKFNKKAEESYAPWEDGVDDDATAVNPLYQESGSKGENALYEARTDAL